MGWFYWVPLISGISTMFLAPMAMPDYLVTTVIFAAVLYCFSKATSAIVRVAGIKKHENMYILTVNLLVTLAVCLRVFEFFD